MVKHLSASGIPAGNLCIELVGKEISTALDDIMLLEDMGVKICIDRFENSRENREILNVVKPCYIKMSRDILHSDIYATSEEDIAKANEDMVRYFIDVISNCHENGIKACICGIERKEQDYLADNMGFDFKQGYYYSRPERMS